MAVWNWKIIGILAVVGMGWLTQPLEAAEVGVASYYGAGENLNGHTAMNLPFDARLLECASWEYPLGSVLEVTSLRTGKSVVVRCTDRGPAKRFNRIVDLTLYAFTAIDDPQHGLTPVRVTRIK